VTRLGGRIAAVALVAWSFGADARADWLITPFVGGVFAGETRLPDLEGAVPSTKLTYGVSTLWLSDEIVGVEADLSYVPAFFDRGNRTSNLIASSRASAFSGNIVVAVPLSITRESLRPYVSAGLGVVHASLEDLADVLTAAETTETAFAVSIGGGAIGLITNRVGMRFDLRQLRSFRRGANFHTGRQGDVLSFWRATAGVVIRY
jgi:hypothetical protein